MDNTERPKLIVAIEKCFFEGMRRGWASGAPAKANFPFNGAKGYEFHPLIVGELDRHLHYMTLFDYFFTNQESRTSYGTTVILYLGNPVWVMNYGGWYRKEAVPIVKKALMAAYKENLFCGGRGINGFFCDECLDLEYENRISKTSDTLGIFEDFHGDESVRNNLTYDNLGYHYCRGGLLI